MNCIYQNNSVKNNNQQVFYNKSNKLNKIQDTNNIFRKKVNIKYDNKNINTIILGQTDKSYVTYDGLVIPKDKVISINEV